MLDQTQKIGPPNREAIALALGGGAARGWAHIGVLRALDEAGIKIGMIAGTSIGALVGGCYLAGRLDELEEFARSLTPRRIFSLMDVRLRGNGLLGGMRLNHKMQKYMEGLQIEDLSTPFVSVATEITSGHEVWINQGDLITAMRASYALPGVFEPIHSNGRVLVDGALVNPVPVSVCRTFEFRNVVAVNLHYDLYGRAAVIKHSTETMRASVPKTDAQATLSRSDGGRYGAMGVMVEAFNIIQDRISRSKMAGDPPDLQIRPRLAEVGLTDFHRAAESIEYGYEATLVRLGEIKRMSAERIAV